MVILSFEKFLLLWARVFHTTQPILSDMVELGHNLGKRLLYWAIT